MSKQWAAAAVSASNRHCSPTAGRFNADDFTGGSLSHHAQAGGLAATAVPEQLPLQAHAPQPDAAGHPSHMQ